MFPAFMASAGERQGHRGGTGMKDRTRDAAAVDLRHHIVEFIYVIHRLCG
jgi:hypothetical protein